MRIVLLGKSTNRISNWRSYTSLRDVLKVIEDDRHGEGYQALRGFEGALEGTRLVDALQLRADVLRAWSALWRNHFDRAALGTQARVSSVDDTKPSPAPQPGRTAGGGLPLVTAADAPIPRAARRFILSILVVTESAEKGDLLEVRCDAEEARFVRHGLAPRRARPPSRCAHASGNET